jgi:hypothetical protein
MYAQLILPAIKSEIPRSRPIAGTIAAMDATLNAMQNPWKHRMRKSERLMKSSVCKQSDPARPGTLFRRRNFLPSAAACVSLDACPPGGGPALLLFLLNSAAGLTAVRQAGRNSRKISVTGQFRPLARSKALQTI